MTTAQLNLKQKLDNTIPYLSEKQLYLIFSIAETFVSSQQQEVTRTGKLPPKNPKFGGRRISDKIAAMFLSGPENHDTDEEVDEKIWEYIKEKYK